MWPLPLLTLLVASLLASVFCKPVPAPVAAPAPISVLSMSNAAMEKTEFHLGVLDFDTPKPGVVIPRPVILIRRAGEAEVILFTLLARKPPIQRALPQQWEVKRVMRDMRERPSFRGSSPGEWEYLGTAPYDGRPVDEDLQSWAVELSRGLRPQANTNDGRCWRYVREAMKVLIRKGMLKEADAKAKWRRLVEKVDRAKGTKSAPCRTVWR